MSITLADFDGCLLDGLEFCSKTYALFEQVRSLPGGVERLRGRSGATEKRLLEELLPICRYVQNYYRLGRYISVKWVNGSQSYDAELQQHGEYVSKGYFAETAYLEATCAMHANEHWVWKLLNQGNVAYAPEGIAKEKGKPVESVPFVFSNTEHVTRFAQIITSLIRKKSEIEYPPNTSLVVQCQLNSLYTSEDWRLLVSQVETAVSATRFVEVLLFDGTTERTTPLSIRMA